MTETSAPFTIVVGEDYETHPTSCGYAMPIGDMRIVGRKRGLGRRRAASCGCAGHT